MNEIFRMKNDGFHAELFRPVQDNYPDRALICFGGSDGKFEPARMLAAIFQVRGLATLALAYVMEEGLPDRFHHVPIDPLEAAERIMARLRAYDFSYPYRHLNYDYGSHLFVPMELRAAKFFRGDRGKNREPGRRARMDSLEKTLEFVSQW